MTPADGDGARAFPEPLALLAQLGEDLAALRSAVQAGSMAPREVIAGLDRTAAQVTDVTKALAAADPGSAAAMRSAAAAMVLDILTPRERQVAEAVLSHGTTARAAHAIGMSEATLGHHRSNILRKLKATNFAQIARLIAADSTTGG